MVERSRGVGSLELLSIVVREKFDLMISIPPAASIRRLIFTDLLWLREGIH